jgi:hypothetical protein
LDETGAGVSQPEGLPGAGPQEKTKNGNQKEKRKKKKKTATKQLVAKKKL